MLCALIYSLLVNDVLTINKTQMEVFEYQSMDLFIKKSIPFLKENAPEFTKDKLDEELEVFIRKVIQFAESHNIKKETNVQRIMLFKIEHNFKYHFSDELEYTLSGTSFGESYRLDKFEKLLISKKKQRAVITLNADI